MKATPLIEGLIHSRKRVLEPNDRITEILFGLIMVLGFTGSLSIADAGRDDINQMLIGALGCNLAWGIIDGLMYLMGCLSEQGRGIRALRALRLAASPEEAQRIIADTLPPMVAASLAPAEYESLRQKLLLLPAPPTRPRLGWEEVRGALAVLFWVFVVMLPVAVPFIFMKDVSSAMRVSNAIALILLYLAGYAFGRITEFPAWLAGCAMVVIGSAVVALTMMLGG